MIENHTQTEAALNRVYLLNPEAWEETLFDDTEYAMELGERNPLLEGVVRHLKKLGMDFDEKNKKEITGELNKRYKSMGIEEGIPKSVRNWIDGTPVNPAYRENLYNLCLALEMDVDETKEFFLKNYLTIPFNFKDRRDAIYFFGIKNKLSYKDIVKIFHDVENEFSDNSLDDQPTRLIGNHISEIKNIEKFEEYVKQYSFDQKSQFSSASKKIEILLRENEELAKGERLLREEICGPNTKKVDSSDPKERKVNIKSLLLTIYGYDNQESYKNKELKISKCEYLPKMFRENFPNDEEFSRIMAKKASPDVYRKALVIMIFYNFFCSNYLIFIYGTDNPNAKSRIIKHMYEYTERDDETIKSDMKDFYEEANKQLAICGFEQMYARNPFDWLLLYCARSTDPLDAFRELLSVRYIEHIQNDDDE